MCPAKRGLGSPDLANMLACRFCCFVSVNSNGHSAATSAATFSVAVAALPFFVTSEKRQRRCFLVKNAAALQRCL